MVGLGVGIYLVQGTRTVNYQVLKGMSLKLRKDSLLYGRETIVTLGQTAVVGGRFCFSLITSRVFKIQ